MDIGQAIRTIRVAKRLTLKDVADRAGIAESYLSLLERQRRDPTYSTVCNICQAMDIPTVLVIYLTEREHPLLEPLQQRMAHELIKAMNS